MRLLQMGLIALFCGLLLLTGAQTARANDPLEISRQAIYKVIDVRSDDVLNMRAGPSPRERKVGEIPYNGRDIHTTGQFRNYKSRRWAEVIYGPYVGWVSTRYLDYEDPRRPPSVRDLYNEYGLSVQSVRAAYNPPKLPVSCGPLGYPYSDERIEITSGDIGAGARPVFWRDLNPGYQLSMSDAFFRHFKNRGFSKEALCLGLGTPMSVDITTGFGAPAVAVEDPWNNFNYVMLNLPDCFAGGTPLLDCEYNFNMIWGDSMFYPEMAADKRARGRDIDRAMQNLIASGKVSDGEIILHDRAAYLLGEDAVFGWFFDAVPGDLQYIIVSKNLPRGYGYRIHTARVLGDDDGADEETAAAIAAKSFTATDASFSVPWKVKSSVQTGN